MSNDPPYLERLDIEKLLVQPKFNIESQLRNICVRIPLLQDLRDIPIYDKIVKELFLKKLGRKRKEPPTIHFIGKATKLMSGKFFVEKHENPRNPVVSIRIRGCLILNTLNYLGESINIMTLNTMQQLEILDSRPTPTILVLADRSRLNLKGCWMTR